MIARRSLLGALAGAIAAPAVLRSGIIMPVRRVPRIPAYVGEGFRLPVLYGRARIAPGSTIDAQDTYNRFQSAYLAQVAEEIDHRAAVAFYRGEQWPEKAAIWRGGITRQQHEAHVAPRLERLA